MDYIHPKSAHGNRGFAHAIEFADVIGNLQRNAVEYQHNEHYAILMDAPDRFIGSMGSHGLAQDAFVAYSAIAKLLADNPELQQSHHLTEMAKEAHTMFKLLMASLG